ncbi:aminoglycoside phosphotransferase family protein [Scandinavium lactucae]|uniref:Aminoglycoside phosphotransferase family protein n=1 Tax=Scandinavium lactucae TaxID=3095028 RepID=A0ABU4QPN6_9ENTR|nr:MULTISPECIES: aminoglycoside phosphotransferase family protein [unclassified Scandinavium]MDX6040329.1 aminoglycoside phosphotransferase family protein [Scandinavium sp. V105_6]MDX6051000.1 aminoglycoside phosphotransferase family protein [Scandinavium sp. V105_1]
MHNDESKRWLERWRLVPDGPLLITHTSHLLPVIRVTNGSKAMLKITYDESEQLGNALMVWWEANGAARVFAHENEAILLERATGPASLSLMSRTGQDDAACHILCRVANKLHASPKYPLSALTPLRQWFSPLDVAAQRYGGILAYSAKVAEELLSTPLDLVSLHGDLHHGNVLDFAESGWLAIDPKGLSGERGFDFANIFTNPDLGDPAYQVARVLSIFKQRLEIITALSGIHRERLLMWIIAWCGLSAAWSLEINNCVSVQLDVAKLAIAELSNYPKRLLKE